MENFGQLVASNVGVVIVLAIVVQLCIIILGYLIIDTVCTYNLEHPIVTFFVLLIFGALGFFVELFRNTAVDNTRKKTETQKIVSAQLIETLERTEKERLYEAVKEKGFHA